MTCVKLHTNGLGLVIDRGRIDVDDMRDHKNPGTYLSMAVVADLREYFKNEEAAEKQRLQSTKMLDAVVSSIRSAIAKGAGIKINQHQPIDHDPMSARDAGAPLYKPRGPLTVTITVDNPHS